MLFNLETHREISLPPCQGKQQEQILHRVEEKVTELQRSVAVAAEEKRARVTTLKTQQREVRQQLMTKQREKTRVVLVIIFFLCTYLLIYLFVYVSIYLFYKLVYRRNTTCLFLDNKKTELLLLDYFVILSPLF